MLRIQCKYFAIVAAALLAVSGSVDAFSPPLAQTQQSRCGSSRCSMARIDHNEQHGLVRATAAAVAAATILLSPVNAMALEEDVATPDAPATTTTTVTASITKCNVSKNSPPCVSTSNVRQLDLYAAPWTFDSTADEAMARLKGAVEAEPLNAIVSTEDSNSRHLFADSKRSKLGTTAYRMEFIVNESDGVVTFRSSAPSDLTGPDFGLQRKRLAEIRERAGTFGVMGESLESADTKSTGEKGYGPLGQLKSFYGLQSGGGFEDVLSE
mmetsp:Transcript_24980/g.68890  ORF Transcript_24980/g.68890 Transcript_24980/m.68890 type:complete len:268 (-) Transcript_24980:2300-3103(-)